MQWTGLFLYKRTWHKNGLKNSPIQSLKFGPLFSLSPGVSHLYHSQAGTLTKLDLTLSASQISFYSSSLFWYSPFPHPSSLFWYFPSSLFSQSRFFYFFIFFFPDPSLVISSILLFSVSLVMPFFLFAFIYLLGFFFVIQASYFSG